MFGLDDAEVQTRRQYVGHVRKEIEVGFTLLPMSNFRTVRYGGFLNG